MYTPPTLCTHLERYVVVLLVNTFIFMRCAEYAGYQTMSLPVVYLLLVNVRLNTNARQAMCDHCTIQSLTISAYFNIITWCKYIRRLKHHWIWKLKDQARIANTLPWSFTSHVIWIACIVNYHADLYSVF